MITFAVVTETSPIDYALALDIQVAGEGEQLSPITRFLGPAALLSLRAPVFTLGEILLLDEDGREVDGPGRKPSKWGVSIQEFETLDDAVARSQEVRS